ncbi:hypothetical protein POM88_020555 [Heracleum sosnowskyi]|uniref:Reverse transcriptase domain-containing protein n=1 Tax=Heracleum sosnowskyi TaxID=360622 RepID=A0AAD8IC45_9APIA|nr:hypothetical protein POM88_020555 [Heracleum sosnowskyi]
MSYDSSERNRSSESTKSSSSSPPESHTVSQLSNLRSRQRHMQEQMDRLTAQMAGNYYEDHHPPYYPENVAGRSDSRQEEHRGSYQSGSSTGSRGIPYHGSRSSSGSQRTVFPEPSGHRRPNRHRSQRERTPTSSHRQRSRTPVRRRRTPPIIIQQNTQSRQPEEREDLMVRLARLEEMASSPFLEASTGRSPFTEILEAAQVDQGVKITGLESYDGTMISPSADYLFPRSRRTQGLGSPGSPRGVLAPENVKQEHRESLRDYIEKFKTAASKVKELRPTNTVDSFIRNMNYQECRDCCKELCNKEPGDLYEAYGIASAYIATDERIRAYYPGSRSEASGSGHTAMQMDGMEDFRGRGQKNFPSDRRPPPRQTREEPHFTPLNKSPSVILKEIRGHDYFQAPPLMRTPTDKRDRSRFCDYHASIGHNTDECTSLKYFLEKLVSKGVMGSYLHGAGKAPSQPPNPRPRRVIDMIMGGGDPPPKELQELFQLETQRAFRYSKTPISFSDEDYPEGGVCRSGPLTVQLDIDDQDVRKGEKKAEDTRGPLYGFGNHDVPIQGTIDLPTTFGTAPQEVTALVKYYIIDIASSYNVIIGRPTLFFLGAIISTPHMKVKFPTGWGTGELKSDSEASRLCYTASLCLAQTNPRKRKYYEEPKGKGSAGNDAESSGTNSPRVLLVENAESEHRRPEGDCELSHFPRAIPGEPTESVELYLGDSSK